MAKLFLMYKSIIRPVLFLFSPERIHQFVFYSLRLVQSIPGGLKLTSLFFSYKSSSLEREVFGIRFPNPVGLAAGMDKDGEVYDVLGQMGFGFIEIGTVTPKPQPGNDKPRLFRLPANQALINRMGFNNKGVVAMAHKLRKKRTKVIVGGNIGKNKITPNADAGQDYLTCFEVLYPYVDYFVVNVSSPNTPNLRELQDKEPLTMLLSSLRKLALEKSAYKPILLKIAPDLELSQLDDILDIVSITGIDGIVATNTTISREGLSYSAEWVERLGTGGLSGKPLTQRATDVIRYLHTKSAGKVPIIAVGGIMSASDALEKLEAGASLVQIYTGFVYEGPAFARKINKYLASRLS